MAKPVLLPRARSGRERNIGTLSLFDFRPEPLPDPVNLSGDSGEPVQSGEPAEPATVDSLAREQALDPTRSWIVEAPAGSGKTGLLIQRYMTLLAGEDVSRPEQVLAITFTRLATAEIRERVLDQLARAASGALEDGSAFDRKTHAIAHRLLERDRLLGWGLLADPRRLNVRTIDSVCADIAQSLPVLSGAGGGQQPSEQPSRLYREAARRTFRLLGGTEKQLSQALELLLLRRDGNLERCEHLLVEMLGRRDQWGDLIPLRPEDWTDEALDREFRPRLDRALDQIICRTLSKLRPEVPAGFLQRLTELASEMSDRPGYQGGASPIAICRELTDAPEEAAEHLRHWRALVPLVTIKDGGWRKGFNKKTLGFDTDAEDNRRLRELVDEVRGDDRARAALCAIVDLPPVRYPDEQWAVTKALFHVLRQALVELKLVFAETGECDFIEPARLARAALRNGGAGELESATGAELRHLLVDEMQDTSTGQYELIELLTQGWTGEGKTVFLVGDPKQSIYLFREARVERFVQVMRTGRLGQLHLGALRLTANFRSQAALVEDFNSGFERLFPRATDVEGETEVPYVAAEPTREPTGPGIRWHLEVLGADDPGAAAGELHAQAVAIKQEILRWRMKPRPAERSTPPSIAVLARTRSELRSVMAVLRSERDGPAIPFRAVEIDRLDERQEVLDLLALTRALLHRADRIAWLAVLRAPWCGLGVADLHALTGADDEQWREWTVLELLRERAAALSEDGRERLHPVSPVLEAAAERAGRVPLAELTERTWRSLGGDAALPDDELGNALRFLALLADVEREGKGSVDLRVLTERMTRLFAEASSEPGAVDLMTIHRAKGLEWDVVLVPQLERKPPPEQYPLLRWEELNLDDPDAASVMLAPIKGKGAPSEELMQWMIKLSQARLTAERRRLFYVVCTRAREELHLFGLATQSSKGELSPPAGSLLEAAWEIAQPHLPSTPVGASKPADWAEVLPALAAGAEKSSAPEQPARIERLPHGFDARARLRRHSPLPRAAGSSEAQPSTLVRPQGSYAARSFGNTVHALLELAAERLASGAQVAELATELGAWRARAAALLRADGLGRAQVEQLAGRVLGALKETLDHEHGRWLLAQQREGATELRLRSAENSVRIDRLFRAGAEPGAAGEEFLWVIDYKTATHGKEGLAEFLQGEKRHYRAQLETYARVLGEANIRLGLWYPMLAHLEWWKSGDES